MLDRAMPADAVAGSTIPEDTEAEMQLRDGTWVWAQVIGQRKDRQGRWCVGLRWYASPSVGGREGWFILDQRYIRRPNGPLLVGWPGASQPPAPTESVREPLDSYGSYHPDHRGLAFHAQWANSRGY